MLSDNIDPALMEGKKGESLRKPGKFSGNLMGCSRADRQTWLGSRTLKDRNQRITWEDWPSSNTELIPRGCLTAFCAAEQPILSWREVHGVQPDWVNYKGNMQVRKPGFLSDPIIDLHFLDSVLVFSKWGDSWSSLMSIIFSWRWIFLKDVKKKILQMEGILNYVAQPLHLMKRTLKPQGAKYSVSPLAG